MGYFAIQRNRGGGNGAAPVKAEAVPEPTQEALTRELRAMAADAVLALPAGGKVEIIEAAAPRSELPADLPARDRLGALGWQSADELRSAVINRSVTVDSLRADGLTRKEARAIIAWAKQV